MNCKDIMFTAWGVSILLRGASILQLSNKCPAAVSIKYMADFSLISNLSSKNVCLKRVLKESLKLNL